MCWTRGLCIAVVLFAVRAVAQQDETARLNAWLDARYEEELQFSPLTLAYFGRKERYSEVDDFSVAGQLRRLDWLAQSAERLQDGFDYNLLTPQGRISYDVWRFRALSEASLRPFIDYPYVFDQYTAAHVYPVQFLADYHAVDSAQDMRDYIARVAGFSDAIDQLVQRARDAAAAGIRPPRFAYEIVIDQSRELISGFPFEQGAAPSAIWSDASHKIELLQRRGSIDEQAAQHLRENLIATLKGRFRPAYQRLIAWETEDMARADASPRGVSHLSGGSEYYQRQLAYYSHSAMSAPEIHELGLREVARIKGEMEALRLHLGYGGTLQELFAFIRDSPRFYYAESDAGRFAYMNQVQHYLDDIALRLPDFFGVLPHAGLVVKRVESYRERDGGAQFYQSGPADGSRPGVYYLHLSDMRAYNRTDMETTTYHEGSPGHHMQLSIARELAGLPAFRTHESYAVFQEGWALYAEYLAREMGAYQDPYNDFGRLVAEIWRAIRLVVDTGLHVMDWSEEQAVQYMLDNSAIPETAVRAEIRRYLVLPGQAVAYKVGMLGIQSLRAEAQQRLGQGFDLRGFHDAVLGSGALPLPVLEREVRAWIDSEAARQGRLARQD